MGDPHEGVTEQGTITTGAGRDQVPVHFEPVLAAAVGGAGDASVYVYGSVATGTARVGESDVDVLTIGLPPTEATALAAALTDRFAGLCRSVEVAAAQPGDFAGDGDEAYGGRAFLRHYCVHLAGPDLGAELPDFAADRRAARGFNGDIARHARRWRADLGGGADPARLGRRLARKTLLAVAGLVSIHDGTWTTDRAAANTRWGEVVPSLAADLRRLLAWSRGDDLPDAPAVAAALDGVVAQVVNAFAARIGLWDDDEP